MSNQPEHHPTLSPSSFPMLEKCWQFQSGEVGDAAERGTAMHAALAQLMLYKKVTKPEGLNDEDWETVLWARDEISGRFNAPFQIEQRLGLLDADFNVVTFGTADVIAQDANLIDFKSGEERDYSAQMTAYALMLMQRDSIRRVHCHIVYGRFRRIHSFTVVHEEATARVGRIIANVGKGPYTPNEYCAFCGRTATCPALTERALAVAHGREDWKLENYHVSEITDPTQMARAYRLAKLLEKWSESVIYHAKKMAFDDGMEIPGYHAKLRGAGSECTNILEAYKRAGIAPEEFLECCTLSIPTLAKRIAKIHEVSQKAARKEVDQLLDDIIKANPDQRLLVKENDNAED